MSKPRAFDIPAFRYCGIGEMDAASDRIYLTMMYSPLSPTRRNETAS